MEIGSGKIILTKDQAKELIGKRKLVHTFRSGTNILMGDLIEIGGDQCKKMGHGLVIWTGDYDPLFVEADKDAIEKLESSLVKS